jgi:hypothetical protein
VKTIRTTLGFSGTEDQMDVRAHEVAERRNYRITAGSSWYVETAPMEPQPNTNGYLAMNLADKTFDQLLVRRQTVALLSYTQGDVCRVNVWGKTATAVTEEVERLGALYPKKVWANNTDSPYITAQFWFQGQQGPQAFSRQIEAPTWAEIDANYPTTVRSAIGGLMSERPSTDRGKILLWRGVPGTGKTYAIRALCRAWRKDCMVQYIIDPETFLSNPAYLMAVIASNQVQGPRLIVLEDSGELIARDAKSRTGQGLSRLLNVAEGFLGQGLDIYILITTNEDVNSLNDAISRPGRCISNVEFTSFNAAEASVWLQSRTVHSGVPRTPTLAELYAVVTPDAPNVKQKKEAVAGFGAPARVIEVNGKIEVAEDRWVPDVLSE